MRRNTLATAVEAIRKCDPESDNLVATPVVSEETDLRTITGRNG